MEKIYTLMLPLGAACIALLLTVSCSRQEPAADPHAGHNHGKTESAADAHDEHDAPKKEGTATAGEKKMCKEHNVPLDECGICKPELLEKLKPGEGMKVRLNDKESANMAGVQTAKSSVGTVNDVIECYAELSFNQNRFAHVAAPVGGFIQEVMVDLGAQVEEKQVVARIWSASIAEAVAKAVLSHQTLSRERKLRADRVTPEKDLQEAEAVHRSACQQLRTFGFTEEQIDALGEKPMEQVLMDVRTPFAGEIVDRAAVQGAMVESGKNLFSVADRSTMWAMVNIPEPALSRVKLGQTVDLQVESIPGRVFMGKLTWIAAQVDDRSRMARARVEVPNPDRVLKANMFARARIHANTIQGAVLVPSSAIQRIDGKPYVFVKLEDDMFDARLVALGAATDGQQQICEGVKAQEIIVVQHGYSLKSALLISRLGAGCADD